MRADEVHLQQIANYHGPRAAMDSSSHVTGRLFKIDDAVIGLAARSGRVLTTRSLDRSDEECRQLLRDDMKRLNGDNWDPKRMDNEVLSLFACPLVCMVEDGADSVNADKVVAVLFADSTEVAAFDEQTVSQIVAGCEEFGRYLQRIARSKTREVISVKSQATCYLDADSTAGMFDSFSILTASPTRAPRVPVEYINLEWWI
jgi:hypothetical protein